MLINRLPQIEGISLLIRSQKRKPKSKNIVEVEVTAIYRPSQFPDEWEKLPDEHFACGLICVYLCPHCGHFHQTKAQEFWAGVAPIGSLLKVNKWFVLSATCGKGAVCFSRRSIREAPAFRIELYLDSDKPEIIYRKMKSIADFKGSEIPGSSEWQTHKRIEMSMEASEDEEVEFLARKLEQGIELPADMLEASERLCRLNSAAKAKLRDKKERS